MPPLHPSEPLDHIDAKLAAAQKKLDQRRRAYRLAHRTDTTRFSYIAPSFMFRVILGILAFLLIAVACSALARGG